MFSRRNWVVLTASCTFALLWWAFRADQHQVVAPDQEPQQIQKKEDTAYLEHSTKRKQLVGHLDEIRFVDQLDNKLPVPSKMVSLSQGGRLFRLNDEGFIDALRKNKGEWLIDAPQGARTVLIKHPVTASITSSLSVFSVPYRPGVILEVLNTRGDIIEKSSAGYLLIETEKFHKAKLEARNVEREGLWPNGSLARIIRECRDRGVIIEEKYSFDPLQPEVQILEQAGQLLAWAKAKGHGKDWDEVELVPGAISRLTLNLPQRPRVSGTLRDADGAPVSGARIIIATSFGTSPDPDFLQEDNDNGSSLGAGGTPGAMRRVTRTSAWTNSEGYYSAIVARGEAYGAGIALGDSYGFSSKVPNDPAVANEILLDVDLTISTSGADKHRFLVLDIEGKPVEGVGIRIVIVGDFDWMREFPTVITDEYGIAYYPWIPTGTLIWPLVLSNPVKITTQIGSDDYINVQQTETVINLPSSAQTK